MTEQANNNDTLHCSAAQGKNEVLKRIEELCVQRGWTHYALAKNSGVPYSSICNMFHRNTYPSLPVLFKLCEGFRIHVSDFFRDPASSACVLSPAENRLLEEYRGLGIHDQELLKAYLQGLCRQA